jgi:lipoprotein
MDKKLKMRKNMILYMFGMVAVLMGCFFYAPKEVKAAEPGTVQVSATMQTVQTGDIPNDVVKPIENGKKLVAYVVVAAGWVAFLVGLLLLAISFFGHQSDMKIQGLVALGAGALLGVAPTIATWIMS